MYHTLEDAENAKMRFSLKLFSMAQEKEDKQENNG